MYEYDNKELKSLLSQGFSFTDSWHKHNKEEYKEFILFFKDQEVLRWRTDMGICNDLVAIIKKYISDKRDQKLTELGI
jgi:hypothetical protein